LSVVRLFCWLLQRFLSLVPAIFLLGTLINVLAFGPIDWVDNSVSKDL
jgi:hypothetical protein